MSRAARLAGDVVRVSLDWRLAAQRAGNAILEVNPNLLIVVEGVELHNNQSLLVGRQPQRGAEAPVLLTGCPTDLCTQRMITLLPSSRSPGFRHAGLSGQSAAGIWDSHWGYIARTELAPVLMGEFGSKLQTKSDEQWFTTLIKYLA